MSLHFSFATFVLNITQTFGDVDFYCLRNCNSFVKEVYLESRWLKGLKTYKYGPRFSLVKLNGIDFIFTDSVVNFNDKETVFSHAYAVQILIDFDLNECRHAIYLNSRRQWCRIGLIVDRKIGPKTKQEVYREKKYHERHASLQVPRLECICMQAVIKFQREEAEKKAAKLDPELRGKNISCKRKFCFEDL